MKSSDSAVPNRLAASQSPYLLQHANNPVDWYPWGDEAWARARELDVPVLVSVGYSTCHWCHVMAHEVFEHKDAARLMNQKLVCIKVDREVHPDVDEVYMEACQTLTGGGGWPLNVLCDPQGTPFWAGTYLPRERWERLIWEISKLWVADRQKVTDAASHLLGLLNRDHGPKSQWDGTLEVEWKTPLKASYDVVDPCFSGQGSAPRFPQSQLYLFLAGNKNLHDPFPFGLWNVLETLQDSGLHDRVGGGFHRYSTERTWRIPHFEKMLYDNALLMGSFALGGSRFKRDDFLKTAQNIAEYLLRDLSVHNAEGEWLGFGTGEDADDPEGEGAFYGWTEAQLKQELGDEEGSRLAAQWDLIPPPEVAEVDSHGGFGAEPRPWLIPHPRASPVFGGLDAQNRQLLRRKWEEVYPRLRELRNQRPRPALDTKILTDWNALALEGLALLYAQDPNPRWARACENLVTLLARRELPDSAGISGRILRLPNFEGYSTDYGHGALGLATAGEIFGRKDWLKRAAQWVNWGWNQLGDDDGRIFSTPDDRALFIRSQERLDNAYPAGAHALLLAAVRLTHLGVLNWAPSRWEKIWNQRSPVLTKFPLAAPTLLRAWEEFKEGPRTYTIEEDVKAQGKGALAWGGSQIRLVRGEGAGQYCEGSQCMIPPTSLESFLEVSGFYLPLE